MRIKKIVWMIFFLVIAFTTYGCNHVTHTPLQKKGSFFNELKNYEADVKVTFLKDKQPNEIKMKQTANMDGSYEMVISEPEHLKGMKLSYDGKNVLEYIPSLNQTLEEKSNPAQNEILLTSFVKRYLSNENIKKQEIQLNGKKMITYEMSIEGNFKYLAKEKIWLEEKNLVPEMMVLYNDEGDITIEVIYEKFKYNQ